MELFKLLGTVAIETSEANKNIDITTDKVAKSESKLSKAFEKIGAAVATAFAVDKIADFGVACINAAADAGAIASQFAQVFGDYEETAGGSLEKIADDAGISMNRMKSSYTKIAAFAKTTGMETADAMSLADRALVAVADSAAFYDRSLEETTESLQSFLKGNYENDAALGLSCTETTRNAKANELYGQSFKDLSESQKQLTLLAMVEDANKLSGAIGQASRESDTWTNQTGNLSQAWTDFKATIGSNFLDVAVQGVKAVTGWVETLTMKVEPFVGWIQSTAVPAISAVWQNIRTGYEMASPLIDEAVGRITMMAQNVIAIASEIFGIFVSEFEKMCDMFGVLVETIGPVYEIYLQKLLSAFEAVANVVQTWVLPIIQIVIDVFLRLAKSIITNVLPPIQKIMTKFAELASMISTAVAKTILPVVQNFIAMIEELYEENKEKLELIGELFGAVFDWIAEKVEEFVSWFKEYFMPFLEWLCDFVKDNMDIIKNTIQKGIDFISGIIKIFIAFFKGDWEGMWSAVKQTAKAGVDFINGIFEFLEEFLRSILTKIGSNISEKFEEIYDSIVEKLTKAKNKVVSIFTSIKDTIADKIDSIKDIGKSLKNIFNFEFSMPQIKLPHFSIKPEGWEIGDLLSGVIPELGIEWYAKGGVMEEPTAFGINGRNLMIGGEAGPEAIAPITVLQDYIAQAVAAQNMALVAVLERILEAILSMDENMGGNLREALEGTALEVNKREFARLVKAVN